MHSFAYVSNDVFINRNTIAVKPETDRTRLSNEQQTNQRGDISNDVENIADWLLFVA